MQTKLLVRGVERVPNEFLEEVFIKCRYPLLTLGATSIMDELHTPEGETLYYDATLELSEGKLPIVVIKFQDESVWLKED